MDDYYMASKMAKESGELNAMELNLSVDDDTVTGTRDDIDVALNRIAASDDVGACSGGADSFFTLYDDADQGKKPSSDGGELEIPIFPNSSLSGASSAYRSLLCGSAQSKADYIAGAPDPIAVIEIPLVELQQFVASSSNDITELNRMPNQEHDERPTAVIEYITSELDSVSDWSPPEQHPEVTQPLQPCAPIVQVSRAFTLNQLQHAVFSINAKSLLRRFLQQEVEDENQSYRAGDFESRLRNDQLLMFLGGPGGTGKSRVIDAVNAFCCSWNHDDSIIKSALTGKAATLIGGRTLASFLMRIKHAINNKTFDPLDLLVIDEVSMMSKSDFLKLDKYLRRYTQVLGVPFGGVHIVLVGDFLQMPPVNADLIYIDPDSIQKTSTSDIEGFQL